MTLTRVWALSFFGRLLKISMDRMGQKGHTRKVDCCKQGAVISAAAVSDAKKLNLPLEMDAAVARMKLGASDQFG